MKRKERKKKWKESEEIKIIRGPRSILKAESTNTANPSPGSRPKIRGSLALFAEDGHLLMRAQGQGNSIGKKRLRRDLAAIWILAI
uniref:Uncharacterized protein n=1 Tax=Vespula pensylvanica TaxID=30213 RepID=A0A834PEC9_VESPE|nr:hypothetical protein H0235_000692 [Vespula pensylvanica]